MRGGVKVRDYDGMSVHNLLGVAVCTPFLSDEEIVGLESALRSAVIREASVGVVAVPRYGNGEITIDIDEADYVPSADDSIEGHHRAIIENIKKKVPEGKYDLIPREVGK